MPGTTVTSAGLVLAGTFGVFALVTARTSGGSQFEDLSVGLALGILMDTFLVRTLLVPSTVLILGRWNWWPSRLSRVTPGEQQPAVPVGGEPGTASPVGGEPGTACPDGRETGTPGPQQGDGDAVLGIPSDQPRR